MKTNLMKLTMGITLASTVLMSCEGLKTQTKKTEQQDETKVEIVVNRNTMNSQELAEAAEQLVGPCTFMLAYQTAKTAVEKDPTNLKAQFYVHFLKRFEAFRGIMSRVQPILNDEQKKQLAESFKNLPNSPLRNFLTEKTGTPLKSYADVQDVIADYSNSVREFRNFLKKNQTSEMDIYLNPHIFEQAIKDEMKDTCSVVKQGDNLTVDCNYSQIATKKLNSADMIMLTQMQSGEALYWGFYNSYSIDGIEKLQQADPEGKMSEKQRIEFLSQLPNFGKLRKGHMFDILKSIGSDYSAAAKWAMQYQDRLCPKGEEKDNQRRGYLFSKGICVTKTTESEKALAMLDAALAGIIQVDLVTAKGEMINTKLNPFAIANNPIQDLRQIRPIEWNQCGQVTRLADNTLGGIYVENNQNLFLQTDCQK